ncbi:MAG: alcohol acetyltransferase [Clostridia bacterium]|nr:alcohol acetyltransferase [Clostridia bacterium]
MNERPRQRWLKLDNAAKVYPAARSRAWSNVYRLAFDLTEPVDRPALERALERTAKRFPYICARLGTGLFWYYLEPADQPIEIMNELSAPCTCMSREETRRCCMRVRVYENRIAVEIFHAITDGNGGLVFLKTLVAAYLEERYGVVVPPVCGVADLTKRPTQAELEDSFIRNCGEVSRPRKEPIAFRIPGKRAPEEPLSLIRGEIDVEALKSAAKSYGVSITTYLVAALMYSMQAIQAEHHPIRALRKPIRVLVPVNLRPFFGSTTLRNFVLFVTPSIDPKLGAYTFPEIIRAVHHQLGLELTDKQLRTRITKNVQSELNPILKAVPLFIKNPVMWTIYRVVGERASSLTISNLGNVTLPDEMKPYVTGIDFVLGMQSILPYSSSAVSYDGKLRLTFTRSIPEPVLERVFFPFLRSQGICAKIRSN